MFETEIHHHLGDDLEVWLIFIYLTFAGVRLVNGGRQSVVDAHQILSHRCCASVVVPEYPCQH